MSLRLVRRLGAFLAGNRTAPGAVAGSIWKNGAVRRGHDRLKRENAELKRENAELKRQLAQALEDCDYGGHVVATATSPSASRSSNYPKSRPT